MSRHAVDRADVYLDLAFRDGFVELDNAPAKSAANSCPGCMPPS